MKRTPSIASLVIVLCLAACSAICGKGVLESLISRDVSAWLSGQHEIYVSQLIYEQQAELAYALADYAEDHPLVAISRNRETLQSGATLYTFGVYATSEAGAGASTGTIGFDPLVVLGTPVVNAALVERVLATGAGAYAGYGDVSFNRIEDLPSTRSGAYFRVETLGASGDLGSSLVVLGLDEAQFQELVAQLASATGVDTDALTSRSSGLATDTGLVYLYCAGAFAVLAVAYGLLTVTRVLLGLKELGVHLMLGWSRGAFARGLLAGQLRQLLVTVPVGVVGALLGLDGFAPKAAVLGYACAVVAVPVIVALLAMGIAVLPLVTARPVDAIRGSYSRRGFYVLTVSVYLMCLVAVFGGCLAMGEPIEMFASNARTQATWDEVSGWSVLMDFWRGDDRFTGDVMSSFGADVYGWYAEHEHDEGVYLAHTSHYSEGTIQAYLSAHTSLEPFWYLAASPSYLEEIGVELSDELLSQAEGGARVYLVPDTLDASQLEELEEFLRATSRVADSEITTAFMEAPQYVFVSYDGSRELFTWTTDSDEPTYASGFVIYVATASSMVPFESESLVASGLESGYIRLGEKASAALLDPDGHASLGDGASVRFTSVANFIAGTQETLAASFAVFAAVAAVLAATMVVMAACLVSVVNRMRAREVAVRYVLGFGAWDTYRREVLLVGGATLVGIAVSAAAGSAVGVAVGAVLLVISNLALFGAARRLSASVVRQVV